MTRLPASISQLALLLCAPLLGACGPSFDPVSELSTLRVLGVQKDRPYARPGEEVTLRMLWHDASPNTGRPIKRAWFVDAFSDPSQAPAASCLNPPGDLYYACFGGFAAGGPQAAPGELPDEPFELPVPEGDEITVRLDDGQGDPGIVIPRQPGVPAYGLAYVFFAVCAGERFLVDFSLLPGLPLACVDASGNRLGADDFVAGYSAIYSFQDEFVNTNPIITGLRFQGADVTPDCIGAACVGLPVPEIDCTAPGASCVPACADDGEPDCDDYPLEVVVAPESVESDEVSQATYGSDYLEQIWTSYYVNGGSVMSNVKLVNDALEGWNDEQEVEFRAPSRSGSVPIWGVVRDNRGGAEFVRYTVGIE